MRPMGLIVRYRPSAVAAASMALLVAAGGVAVDPDGGGVDAAPGRSR
jgi:hypothetical protein